MPQGRCGWAFFHTPHECDEMLKKQTSEFVADAVLVDFDWESVLVSPDIILRNADGRNHRDRAKDFLGKLNIGNQKYLTKLLDVNISDGNAAYVTAIMQSKQADLITLLSFFARTRGLLSAAVEQYAVDFDKQAQRKHNANFELVKGACGPNIHPFNKLILLSLSDPQSLIKVFLRSLWRSRSTRHAFSSNKPLTDSLCDAVRENEAELSDRFAVKSTVDARLFAHEQIEPGLRVFLYQREFLARPQVDYRNGIQVHHTFGWVLFGVDTANGRVIFKGGGENCMEAVCHWLGEHVSDLTLVAEGFVPFAGYEFGKVSAAFSGDYNDNAEVQLISLALTRGNRRTLAPLEIGPPLYGRSIRSDLAHLVSLEAISVLSIGAIHLMREAVVTWITCVVWEAVKSTIGCSPGCSDDELRESSGTRGFTCATARAASDRFTNPIHSAESRPTNANWQAPANATSIVGFAGCDSV